MVIACWSAKGGSGATVVAVSVAALLAQARNTPVLLVDLGGDVAAAMGQPEPDGPGVAEWLATGDAVPADGLVRIEHGIGQRLSLIARGAGPLAGPARAEVLAAVLAADHRPVVIDCGRLDPPSFGTESSEVRRVLACGATYSWLVVRPCYLALRRAVAMTFRPSGVVLIEEPGRSLEASDVEAVLGVPIVATVGHDAAVGRAVDAGILGARVPAALRRALRAAA
jgi:hypothetical protein